MTCPICGGTMGHYGDCRWRRMSSDERLTYLGMGRMGDEASVVWMVASDLRRERREAERKYDRIMGVVDEERELWSGGVCRGYYDADPSAVCEVHGVHWGIPEEQWPLNGGDLPTTCPIARAEQAERERDEARADLAAAWTSSDAALMEALVQRDEARARVAELEGAIREYVAGTIPHNEAGARALFRLRGALDTGGTYGE